MNTYSPSNKPSAEPLLGPGQLQWSGSGWFGSLFGGTLWLFLGASVLISEHQRLALTWAMCGFVAVALGLGLWSRRDRVLPYPAIKILIVTLWLAATVAILDMVVLAPQALEAVGTSRGLAVGCLAVFPFLLIQFAAIERGAKQQR